MEQPSNAPAAPRRDAGRSRRPAAGPGGGAPPGAGCRPGERDGIPDRGVSHRARPRISAERRCAFAGTARRITDHGGRPRPARTAGRELPLEAIVRGARRVGPAGPGLVPAILPCLILYLTNACGSSFAVAPRHPIGLYLGALCRRAAGPPTARPVDQVYERTRHARAHPPTPHRGGDAAVVHQLLDERHRLPRAAGRSGWTQAGAPADPLRHERAGPRPGPRLQEVGDGRGRRARQVPPARRRLGLRRAGPHGAGVLAPLPADRRAGQLRLGRWRPGRGLPVHRGAAHAGRHRDAGGHRQEHGRFPAQLRRPAPRADRAPQQDPQSARERLERDRGGHGDQHPAAQPARGRQGGPAPDRQSRRDHRRDPEGHQGPGLPDRRLHLRPGRRSRRRTRTAAAA